VKGTRRISKGRDLLTILFDNETSRPGMEAPNPALRERSKNFALERRKKDVTLKAQISQGAAGVYDRALRQPRSGLQEDVSEKREALRGKRENGVWITPRNKSWAGNFPSSNHAETLGGTERKGRFPVTPKTEYAGVMGL